MKKNEIRELNVLNMLVEEYIETGQPVSSGLLCEKYLSDVSAATLRIDLNKIEKKGFIRQPHTSAGRIPTVLGYRQYLSRIDEKIGTLSSNQDEFVRKIMVSNYKDTLSSMHYVMKLLAKETDQLSFIAEPEVAYGFLENLEVFKISQRKLLFVVSLDSGVDKTVIINCDYEISENQLKALVRYVNESLTGYRLYDIQHKYIEEMTAKPSDVNKIFNNFLQEFQRALTEMSSYFIHFEAGMAFLEQPEFESKQDILAFLGLTQRQDLLINMMKSEMGEQNYRILLGEEFALKEWYDYAMVYAPYEFYGIPGYLGVIGPARMNYRKNIPVIRDIAKIITESTQKGMIVPRG